MKISGTVEEIIEMVRNCDSAQVQELCYGCPLNPYIKGTKCEGFEKIPGLKIEIVKE